MEDVGQGRFGFGVCRVTLHTIPVYRGWGWGRAEDRDGEGVRGGSGPGSGQRCCVSLREHGSPRHVQGRLGCAAPEGRPPSFLVRAFLLSAARRVGRRSGNAIGDGGWAPDCECGARPRESAPCRGAGAVGTPEQCLVHGCLALAGASLALCWTGDRAGLAARSDRDLATFRWSWLSPCVSFGSSMSGLSTGNSRAASAQSKQLTHLLLLPLSWEM